MYSIALRSESVGEELGWPDNQEGLPGYPDVSQDDQAGKSGTTIL